MTARTVVVTLILYLLSAALAVLAVEWLSAWLVSESGTEGREAIALAAGPWFARNA